MSLTYVASDPVVAANADGMLAVFMAGNDKEITAGGKKALEEKELEPHSGENLYDIKKMELLTSI